MAVPENYGGVVNMNLSYQSPVQRANREQVPIVSEVFYLEEGFYGIAQSVRFRYRGPGDTRTSRTGQISSSGGSGAPHQRDAV